MLNTIVSRETFFSFYHIYKGDAPYGNQFLLIGTLKMFPRNIFKACLSEIFIREGGLVRPPSKSCRFSHPPLRVPEYGTGYFVACGRRQGLLALDLGSIFEKLLHQKAFNLVTAKN
jgi:hypothetical protein